MYSEFLTYPYIFAEHQVYYLLMIHGWLSWYTCDISSQNAPKHGIDQGISRGEEESRGLCRGRILGKALRIWHLCIFFCWICFESTESGLFVKRLNVKRALTYFYITLRTYIPWVSQQENTIICVLFWLGLNPFTYIVGSRLKTAWQFDWLNPKKSGQIQPNYDCHLTT